MLFYVTEKKERNTLFGDAKRLLMSKQGRVTPAEAESMIYFLHL